MKVDTIVEMENGENFYIADETVQNGVKYYLANKVDENDEPTTDTKIFKETLDGNDIYLDVVKDETFMADGMGCGIYGYKCPECGRELTEYSYS